MRKEESLTDLGKVRIHKNVIASIASIAACEIDGVKQVGQNFGAGLLGLLGKNAFRPIKVEIDKNGEVRIEIPLVVKYGFSIPEVAAKVQENVRNALEKMTNVSLKDVDINIQGIERG